METRIEDTNHCPQGGDPYFIAENLLNVLSQGAGLLSFFGGSVEQAVADAFGPNQLQGLSVP